MPKVSRESADQADHGIVLDLSREFEGYTANFVTFRQDIDHSQILKGLPNDECQCPHWGYVFKGKVTFRFGDREETFEAGDAFYAPPGHVPVENEPGTEYLQFSPSDELRKTSEAINRNMQALQESGAMPGR